MEPIMSPILKTKTRLKLKLETEPFPGVVVSGIDVVGTVGPVVGGTVVLGVDVVLLDKSHRFVPFLQTAFVMRSSSSVCLFKSHSKL